MKEMQPTSAHHNVYENSFNTIYKASHDAPLEVSLRECPDCAELESRQWIDTLKKLKYKVVLNCLIYYIYLSGVRRCFKMRRQSPQSFFFFLIKCKLHVLTRHVLLHFYFAA